MPQSSGPACCAPGVYGESAIAETLAHRVDALDESGHATIAFQASGIEGIKVRITTKAADDVAAEAIIAAEEALIRELLGDYIFGIDDESMETVVLICCANGA